VGYTRELGRRVGDHVPLRRRIRDLLAPLPPQASRPSGQRFRGPRARPSRPSAPFPQRSRMQLPTTGGCSAREGNPSGPSSQGTRAPGGSRSPRCSSCARTVRPCRGAASPISPWVDLACTGETLDTNAAADLTATKASLQRMAGQYLHGADPRAPLASPLYADLSGLPPLLIVVGGDEALLDDSVRLARSAGMAGVDVTLYIGAGMQHIFPIYCGAIPEADAAAAMIGEWIRSRTSRASEV
jgi:monoterpene epsilon-lactone hydrolase